MDEHFRKCSLATCREISEEALEFLHVPVFLPLESAASDRSD